MKNIRTLQILVYIVFALLLLQNVAGDIYQGAVDGFNQQYSDKGARETATRVLPHVALDGSSFTGGKDTVLQAGNAYSVQNINVSADVTYDTKLVKTPWWFEWALAALVIFVAVLLFRMAYNINKVLGMIYKGNMFHADCYVLLRNTAALMLMFTLADYAYERFSYVQHTYIVLPPLKALDTASFNFGALLLAIFIFIIAEVFKRGSDLKEEQDLTI